MDEEIKNKLYLSPIHDINFYKKKLRPIRQKILLSPNNKSNATKSLPDVFKGLNGNVIMQNWNTKKNIPNEIKEYTNYPSLIDKKKILNVKKLNASNLISVKKGHLSLLDKIKKSKYEDISRIETLKDESLKLNNINYNKIKTNDFFKKRIDQRRSNSTFLLEKKEERNIDSLIPLTDRTQIIKKKRFKN